MPKFLSQAEIYRMIQRELPEGVYPDGPPSAYFSTADSDATAKVVSSAYSNLERIYENFFPGTADEKIQSWEVTVFGRIQSSSLGLAERRSRIIAKLRELPNMWLWNVLIQVLELVPAGTHVQIYENCKFEGGWLLDVSELDFDTYLDFFERIVLANASDYCNPEQFFDTWILDVSELDHSTEFGGSDDDGLSGLDWGYQQLNAYSYFVRVFGYVLSAEERAAIDAKLLRIEPARSFHMIADGLDLADFDLNTVVTDVNQFSGVNCVVKDAGSSTGYSGRI